MSPPRLFSGTVQAVWGICKGRHWDWAYKWQCDIDRKAKAYVSKTLTNRQIGKAPTSPLGGAFVATRGRLSFINKSMKATSNSINCAPPSQAERSEVIKRLRQRRRDP